MLIIQVADVNVDSLKLVALHPHGSEELLDVASL
jgi:hypothetical protein